MSPRAVILLAVVMLSGAMNAAARGAPADPCASPPEVARWLGGQPGWRIVRLADLGPDDRDLWRKAKPGQCPGLARARLDGAGVSYGLVLIRPRAVGYDERVVIFLRRGRGLRAMPHGRTVPIGNPAVISANPPTRILPWDGGGEVRVAHDSLTLEQLEAWAEVIYLRRGRLVSVRTSD